VCRGEGEVVSIDISWVDYPYMASTAPPNILWWLKFEILFDPLPAVLTS
jgi:hypothetical protein